MMVLMSALLVGFTTAVMSDQTYRTIDRDRARAFYGAQSGIEKQNADLAFFDTNFLNPALLPPLTPVFRDINALGFTQETRPGR